MKITLVPSSSGTPPAQAPQFLTSFLLNDTVALDAGSLGFYRQAQDQARIRHVLISHTHIDHIASLPIFVENVYEGRPDCVTVYGQADVLECLRSDLFNDRVWPDFLKLSRPEAPFLRVAEITPGIPIELDGLRITPVPVDHVVPTLGFIVEDRTGAVVFSSDTGPTQELWDRANALTNLKAVFLEVTFPNELAWLAKVSKHLTPEQFGGELKKLRQPVSAFAVHLKARFRQSVAEEVLALGMPNVRLCEAGHTYTF